MYQLLTTTLMPALDIELLSLVIQLVYFAIEWKIRKKILTFKEYAEKEEARVVKKYDSE